MDDFLAETVSLSESEHAFHEPPEPKAIGSGMVKSVLGKGGASIVYEIWNSRLEISRAVKLWRPFQSQRAFQRFETEIKITAKLHHPNIVEIHTVGEWSGLPYIEMEKIEGASLKELLSQRESFPPSVATAIAIHICRALAYAHTHTFHLSGKKYHGVIHCDIKPANIMISRKGSAILMDFGIAHPTNKSDAQSDTKITGSLQYVSPEQLQSGSSDARADIYALGVVLYEMYSGTKAFPARTHKELLSKRKENDYVPLGAFCKDLNPRIRTLVTRCMDLDPENRFQSAHELLYELETIYSKLTHLSPERLIQLFLADKPIPAKHNDIFAQKTTRLAFAAALVFLSIIPVIWFLKKEIRRPSERVSDQMALSTESATPVQDTLQPEPEITPPKTAVSAGKKVTRKPSAQRTQSRKKSALSPTAKGVEKTLSKPAPSETPEEAELVSDETILKQQSDLLKSGDLKKAGLMLREFPIRDGEYHLLYAEYYLRKGDWRAALKETEKASGLPANRIGSSELRNEVFFLKAKCLSAQFEASSEQKDGQTAMEAWYDLKYMLRANTSNSHYIYADKEIRRISAALQ